MTYLRQLEGEPWRFGFFDALRRLERTLGATQTHSARPRIGDSASRHDETISLEGRDIKFSLGQDPWMAFPGSNLSAVQWRPEPSNESAEFEMGEGQANRLHLVSKFLGLLGPQGALPFAQTEETYSWLLERDSAYAHFLDIFNNRFLQLFFRAWADARPIAQHDRPECDRFRAYVNSIAGIGSPAFDNLAAVPSGLSLYAGLLGSRIKSSSRLKSAIRGLFGVVVEIEELVGCWLVFEESELTKIGRKNSVMGGDLLLGRASLSVQDKFRVRIVVETLERYRDFLPVGADCRRLADLVFFHIGEEMEWELDLALPSPKATPVRLGLAGELGWTSWMAPDLSAGGLCAGAKFDPAESLRRKSVN
jgi:type VI secretion system protein ImpH